MVFVYTYWNDFCKQLKENGIESIPACKIESGRPFLVLKHDIECDVPRAYKMAEIENKYGHCGSYYAHAYLLDNPKNVELLQKMQAMGHEVSYHYDVMDSNMGDIEQATKEFERNISRFEAFGFHIKTVCQHGNPVVERVGYTSNRDFFRNNFVRQKFPEIADIMVNYKEQYNTDYQYFSDAGRKFKLIYDPINNDIVNSDDKNVSYESLDEILLALPSKSIISTHPHRWTSSKILYLSKEKTFLIIKAIAKVAMKISFCKKIMSRYYYLAKKV